VLVFLATFGAALGIYAIGVSVGPKDGIIAVVAGGLVTCVVLMLMRMDVEVERDRMRIVMGPFVRRDVPLASVAAVISRRLRPIEKRVGFEMRRKSRAFMMGSSTVVELSLHDGTRVIVGTRRPEELVEAIRVRLGPAGRATGP
jgi:hypothetical protein